ncbi:hypothetical protein JL722_4447 [Aureococcus anophagefferens]|nr:hypothetical protein JL722_4447 [Aureococcus anophagefferens]
MVDVLLRYAPPGPDGSQVTFRVSRVPAEKKVSALRKAFLRAFAQKHGGSPTVEKLLRCADGAVLSEAATVGEALRGEAVEVLWTAATPEPPAAAPPRAARAAPAPRRWPGRRGHAWRRVELRGGGGVTWRGDAESHVLLRAVVSEAERARLEAIILALKDRGARPNPAGRGASSRATTTTCSVLGAADADGPADLEGADLFATAANLFERHAALAHCDSLRPVIDRRAVDVDDGDAWAFLASKREHETTVSEAAAPRVVLGFGWALAA